MADETNTNEGQENVSAAASASSAIPLTVHVTITGGRRSRELRLGRSVAAELAASLLQMLRDTSPEQCGIYRIEV